MRIALQGNVSVQHGCQIPNTGARAPKNRPPAQRLIGYARVSTDEQNLNAQIDALRAAGVADDDIYREHASGADRSRPVLAKLLRDIRTGDKVFVVRLDRVARSVAHLLSVIEHLDRRGAFFQSLKDPVDTSTAQGRFSLTILGAVAELERSLIRERTTAGIRAAMARGVKMGAPPLRDAPAPPRSPSWPPRGTPCMTPSSPPGHPHGCRSCSRCAPLRLGPMSWRFTVERGTPAPRRKALRDTGTLPGVHSRPRRAPRTG